MNSEETEPQLIMPVKAPPKIVQRQVDDIQRGAAVSRDGQVSNLPVLEAFQAFLEQERAKGRTKMAIITWSYLLLLVLVCLGGYFAVSSIISHMRGDISDFQDTSITAMNKIEQTSAGIEDQLVVLKSELRKSEQEKEDLSSALTALESSHAEKMKELSDMRSTLEVENAALRQSLSSLEESINHLGGDIVVAAPGVSDRLLPGVSPVTPPKEMELIPRLPGVGILDEGVTPSDTTLAEVETPVIVEKESIELPVSVGGDGDSEVNLRIPDITLE